MTRTKPNVRKGMGLIVVILVLAFLLAVGMTVISVTQTGPEVAGSVRLQQQTLETAEAGFDVAWRQLSDQFSGGLISDFSTLYRTTYNGSPGLDDPLDTANYFRRLSDKQLVDDVKARPDNELFADVDMPGKDPDISSDNWFGYTVFLINDEALGTQDVTDCILVSIGRGPRNSYARIEVEIALQ
ncbi:MAG: hypothetical protein MUQ00_12275 [Candidatus Aminicenantes bacterium]|nr:hypothetical protein [Candidatus Aminicenantes bacterium]